MGLIITGFMIIGNMELLPIAISVYLLYLYDKTRSLIPLVGTSYGDISLNPELWCRRITRLYNSFMANSHCRPSTLPTDQPLRFEIRKHRFVEI